MKMSLKYPNLFKKENRTSSTKLNQVNMSKFVNELILDKEGSELLCNATHNERNPGDLRSVKMSNNLLEKMNNNLD